MKKLLLIHTNTSPKPYPVPPLGLCLLAAYLATGYDTRIWDGFSQGTDGLSDFIKNWNPDYIGLGIRNIDDTVMGSGEHYVDGIIRDFIRPVRKATSAPLILGGSGFSIFPAALMELTGADYGVSGEGEQVLQQLLGDLDEGVTPEEGPNLLIKGNARTIPASRISAWNPESFPASDMDLRMDYSVYRSRGAYGVQTKRGCNHDCIYCTYPVIEGKELRIRDPDDIAEEISQLYRRTGPMMVEFVDSIFNDPPGHAEGICRSIIRKKIRMQFRTMGINPGNTSHELFDLMKDAGFTQVDVTPDSASEPVLRNLRKGFGPEDVVRTAALLRQAELPALWFFLFGGPGETEETARETIHFIEAHLHPEDMAWLSSGLRIYPGTPLHRLALQEGQIRTEDNLLFPSVFYISERVSASWLGGLISEASGRIPQCVPATQTMPPATLLTEALELRRMQKLDEPLFRTLLRLRRKGMKPEEIQVRSGSS
jgi:radical SAM superfamily enzyme YgiQ (UPF0313 family)